MENGNEKGSQAEEVCLEGELSVWKKKISECNMPTSIAHARLMRDVHMMLREVCREENGSADVVVLASKLSAIGYKVYLRSALGGGDGISCYYNLANEFLRVSSSEFCSEEEPQDFIIEVRFREHFRIPQPTSRYAMLLEAVPEVVIATPTSFSSLVQLICSEMAFAFSQMGLSLPPWRQAKSLITKWLPTRSKDYDICTSCLTNSSTEGSSPTAVTISEISSGAITPMGSQAMDSPRAVLRYAADALKPCCGDDKKEGSSADLAACNRVSPRQKMKSLLSETLADLKRSSLDMEQAGQKSSRHDNDVSDWLGTIRRVRMQGTSY